VLYPAGASPVVVEKSGVIYNVSAHCQYLEDKSGRLTFDMVRSPSLSKEFKNLRMRFRISASQNLFTGSGLP
jgi:hypothetical protein